MSSKVVRLDIEVLSEITKRAEGKPLTANAVLRAVFNLPEPKKQYRSRVSQDHLGRAERHLLKALAELRELHEGSK